MFSCSYPSEALSPVCSWHTVVDKVTRWTENEWLPLNEHFTLEWRGLQRTFLLSPLFYYDFHTFIIVFIYAVSFRIKMQFSERSKVEIATIITHVKKQFNWHSIQAIKYKDLIHVQLHMKRKSNTRQKNYLINPFKMIENSLPALTIWSPWNRTSVFKSLIPLKIILILRRNICKILWELCWLYILHIYANRLERSNRRRDLYIKFNQ